MFGIHILAADGAHLGINVIGVRLLAVNQLESGFQTQISHGKRVLDDQHVDLAGFEHADRNHIIVKTHDAHRVPQAKLLDGVSDAEGGQLVEGHDRVDLGMAEQQSACFRLHGFALRGAVDLFHNMRAAFPRGGGLKALLPLLAVFTVDIEADNADIQLVPAAVEQRARRRLARPVIVRPDADGGAVWISESMIMIWTPWSAAWSISPAGAV